MHCIWATVASLLHNAGRRRGTTQIFLGTYKYTGGPSSAGHNSHWKHGLWHRAATLVLTVLIIYTKTLGKPLSLGLLIEENFTGHAP